MNDDWKVTVSLVVRTGCYRLSGRLGTLGSGDGVACIGISIATPIEDGQVDRQDAKSSELMLEIVGRRSLGSHLPTFVIPALR